MSHVTVNNSRWRRRLKIEMSFRKEFRAFDKADWSAYLKRGRVTSNNYDTVVALDWPHYCAGATESCGGETGWCYTFQGYQVTKNHNRHVAMVDTLARRQPVLFGEKVAMEVSQEVGKGTLTYPNLRYSGSGEVTEAHIPALSEIALRGIKLWGFTRIISIAEKLRDMGASVIVSCDATSDLAFVEKTQTEGFPIAYTSESISDLPPTGTVVTFPIHREGKVKEVVDVSTLCPKVVSDFLYDARTKATCQQVCTRCHE